MADVYMGPILPCDYSPDGEPYEDEIREPEFPELWCEHAPDDAECEVVVFEGGLASIQAPEEMPAWPAGM